MPDARMPDMARIESANAETKRQSGARPGKKLPEGKKYFCDAVLEEWKNSNWGKDRQG